jgi:hypothetical protein
MDSAMSFVGQWGAPIAASLRSQVSCDRKIQVAGRALRRGIFFRPISWMAHRIGGRKKPPR